MTQTPTTARSLLPACPWLLVRVWSLPAGGVRVVAGGCESGEDWRQILEGPDLGPLLGTVQEAHDPQRTRLWLSVDEAAQLERALPGLGCHNLVTPGKRRLPGMDRAEPVRSGAVIQGTLGVNRLLGADRWLKLQTANATEQERRLRRDLDAFADAADYLWHHGRLRLARPAGLLELEPGWYRPDPDPLMAAFSLAAEQNQTVCVQLSPARIDPDLRHSEVARISGLEARVAHSDLGEYPLDAVFGLDRGPES